MKSVDVKLSAHIGFVAESKDKDPKFKVGDHVRVSKYKSIFAKDYTPNSSKEILVIKKIKNTVARTYVRKTLKGKKLLESFTKRNSK